jgi:hypothetical protein
MFAQFVEGGTTRDRREEMDRIVHDQMLPRSSRSPVTRVRPASSTATPATR